MQTDVKCLGGKGKGELGKEVEWNAGRTQVSPSALSH